MPTLPVLHARRTSSEDLADLRLLALLDSDLSDDAQHAEALALLRAHPAMEAARDDLRRVADDARSVLGAAAGRPRSGPRSSPSATRRHPHHLTPPAALAGPLSTACDALMPGVGGVCLRRVRCRVRRPSIAQQHAEPPTRARSRPAVPPASARRRSARPVRNCSTGARYCSRPITVSGTRRAAAAKKSRGTAVATPALASRAACPGSVVAEVGVAARLEDDQEQPAPART